MFMSDPLGTHQEFADVRDSLSGNRFRNFAPAAVRTGRSGSERIRENDFPILEIIPKFRIARTSRFFTIGSCFARNIEIELFKNKFDVLTARSIFPAELYGLAGGARNGALNAYTPHSMDSLVSLPDRPDAERAGILRLSEDKDEWADMLLSGLRTPLNGEETKLGRDILLSTYRQLPSADVVVITLGYTEGWYDKIDDIYVNRSPGTSKQTMRHGDRYAFANADSVAVRKHLDSIVANINAKTGGRARIIITVSPVPFAATWTSRDAVIANSYSKCTLATEANYLASRHDNIDYFPSYEMVTLGNPDTTWEADGVHVKDDTVRRIIGMFIEKYIVD